MKRILSIVLAAAMLCCMLPLAASAAEPADITEDFTDLNFRAAVYRAVRKTAPAPIYDTDTANVTTLRAPDWEIQSLAGLEHFTALKTLDCYENQLTSLPELPATLVYLDCMDNQLTTLPELPAGLVHLDCMDNQLTSLPALPDTLERLYCQNNKLTSLPDLPANLDRLYCKNNQLASMPSLPAGLTSLLCSNNKLTALDVTGLELSVLDCTYNNMTGEHLVKGFTGMWKDQKLEYDEPSSEFYYYPQNVKQKDVTCDRGHYTISCFAGGSSFAFYGDNDPPTSGTISHTICENGCGTTGGSTYRKGLSVLYRNNLYLPSPSDEMKAHNFRYEVKKGGEYIEVVEKDGVWQIRSKKNFRKYTQEHEIYVVSDIGSFHFADVDVYLRLWTWNWFKTCFLFGWIWF